jgi:hypothetical protein
VYDDATKRVNLETHQAQLSIADVTLTEPNSGTVSADFAVTLSDARSNGVSANFATADGTAKAPADYTNSSGTLIWAAGDSSTKHVLVPVKADALDEFDETFTVILSANSHASILDGSGTGTIQDDPADVPPTVSINDVSQNEGKGVVTLGEPLVMSHHEWQPSGLTQGPPPGACLSSMHCPRRHRIGSEPPEARATLIFPIPSRVNRADTKKLLPGLNGTR